MTLLVLKIYENNENVDQKLHCRIIGGIAQCRIFKYVKIMHFSVFGLKFIYNLHIYKLHIFQLLAWNLFIIKTSVETRKHTLHLTKR